MSVFVVGFRFAYIVKFYRHSLILNFIFNSSLLIDPIEDADEEDFDAILVDALTSEQFSLVNIHIMLIFLFFFL
jgi:hypothetical protein